MDFCSHYLPVAPLHGSIWMPYFFVILGLICGDPPIGAPDPSQPVRATVALWQTDENPKTGVQEKTQPPQPPAPPTKVDGYEQQFPSMGTLITLQAFSADKSLVQKAFESAEKEVERLVNMMSDYDPDSELSKINLLAGSGQWSSPSPELWEVLEASDKWHRLSNGTFDASLGALTRMWRKARRQKKIPSEEDVHQALQHCGWKHVELDREQKRIRLSMPGMYLDLGAIAKGYIVDRAYQILLKEGLKSCMVNAGGNLRCGDAPPDRPGWRIEITSLQEGEPPLRRIYLKNAAISTSGDLWQFMLIDGKRRSHILDAKTGWGLEGPVSVSVIAPNAQDADAASTSMCALGRIQGAEVLAQLPGFEALFLSKLDHEKSLEEAPITYSATAGFSQGSN